MFSTQAIKAFAQKARAETDGTHSGLPSGDEESEQVLPAGMTKVRSKYAGAGTQMARDVVSHLMMRFFFKDQAKNKTKTTKLKEDFIKDMNFTLLTGTVTKATRYFGELSIAEQVSPRLQINHQYNLYFCIACVSRSV